MSRRAILFTVLVVACVAAAVSYVAVSRSSSDEPAAAARALALPGEPFVLFRSLDRSEPADYGRIGVAPAADPGGAREVGGPACERVHFAAGVGICLEVADRFPLSYKATVLDDELLPTGSVPLNGFPSRARVSPDGRLGSVTTFVSGHSYAELGVFSTETRIIDMERGEILIDNLEDVPVTLDGDVVDSVDVNFWGVTFAPDGDRFYATLSTAGRTHLVEGSIGERRMTVIHENAECPSLSPDGTRVAYKKRTGGDGLWRLTVLDLASMSETQLAEEQPIDDQVEWLGSEAVLYKNGEAVWSVPADGSGAPERLIAGADSPAAVGVGAER